MSEALRNKAYKLAESNRATLKKARFLKSGTNANRQAAEIAAKTSNDAAVAAFGPEEGGPVAYTREGELLTNILPIVAMAGFGPEVSGTRFLAGETFRKLGESESGAVEGTINRQAGAPARANRAKGREDVELPIMASSFHILINGTTPLIRAAATGDDITVRRLIAEGAPLENVDTAYRYTALFWAVENNHEQCVQALLSIPGRTANVNVRALGRTPLLVAVSGGFVNIVYMLIENSANVDAVSDNSGLTSLAIAVSSLNIEIITLLLENQANIHFEMPYTRRTVLHLAVDAVDESQERIDVINLLIEHEADINARDNLHHTPLFIARRRAIGRQYALGTPIESSKIIRLLERNGAKVGGATRKHRKTRKTNVMTLF